MPGPQCLMHHAVRESMQICRVYVCAALERDTTEQNCASQKIHLAVRLHNVLDCYVKRV